jgi:rhodanese-related sulfurtransferase
MNTITTDQLVKRMNSGPVAIFDVRGDLDYEIGHIPGAKTAPMGSLVFRVASIMNPESFIVVYSADGDCEMASQAVTRLENMKMKNVHCYVDGVEGWLSAGHKMVEQPHARMQARGPVENVRQLVVDREKAYGGAFSHPPIHVAGAGG